MPIPGRPRTLLLLAVALTAFALAACQQPAAQGGLLVPTVESAREWTPVPEPTTAPTPLPTEAPTAAPAPTAVPAPQPTTPALASSLAPRPTSFSADRAYADLQHLAVRIGSRVAGSPAQHQAADYLESQYRAAGLQVERQPLTFGAFDDHGSSLEVVAPGRATFQPQTLAYSAGGEVEAELIEVDLARPGDFDPAAVRGKIALAKRGEIRFAQKVANLAAAGARGVVIFNNVQRGFSGSLSSPAQIPTTGISLEEGEQLLDLMKSGPVTVRLKVDATVREGSGDNVVATKPGGPRTVVIGGHYDSVAAGPGANDNGSGTATILEVARVAATRDYPFSVRFVAFEAEEIGLLGSAHYVRQLDDPARAATLAMINLDMVGVGDRLSFGGDAPLVELARRSAAQLGIPAHQLRGNASSASDHASFQAVGIPSLFIYRGEDPNYHTANDRADYVSPDNLAIAGQIVLDLLDALAAGEPATE